MIARKFKPDINVGEFLVDPLPPIDFGRIAAQTAKQVTWRARAGIRAQEAVRESGDRVGEIINGAAEGTHTAAIRN